MRVRRHVVETNLRMAVEFADLLDPIRTESRSEATVTARPVDADMAFADQLVADMLVATATVVDPVTVTEEAEPESEVAPELDVVPELDSVPEPELELVPVSRFADAGIDDDRLPLQAPTKRFRLR